MNAPESRPRDGAHLDEGELVRVMDGEVPPDNGSGPMTHLRACADCRAALDRIAARSARVSRLLALAAPSVPAGAFGGPGTPSGGADVRSVPWLRAAAIAALMALAAALGSSTVRAWMAEGWAAFRSGITGLDTPTGPSGVVPRPSIDGITRAAFAPRAGPFVIRFEEAPAGGSLAIAVDGGEPTRSRFIYGSMDELLVLPDGIAIRNARGANTDYGLTLPTSVGSVIIILGGDTIDTLRGEDLRSGRVWRFSESR